MTSCVDENDFERPAFVRTQGVSGEGPCDRAHEGFSNTGARPFIRLVFTSSNGRSLKYRKIELNKARMDCGN